MFKFEDNDNKVFCIKDSNVELSATFEALPKDLDTITIEWTRDGKPITNSEKFKVTKTKNAIQLAIQHVQRDDAGHYTLYAKTDTGETAQKDIELLVEDRSFGDNPPAFIRRLNDLAVKVGTRTRLLVEIRSATDVRVTWYRNDRRICENDRINFVNEGSFYCLEISSITLDDGGKWMCMAENLGGRNSCLATLNVLVPKAYKAPEFVEELRAILTEQGTVSLECKVVGVPTPVLRWFKDSKEIKAGDVFALTANPDDLTSLGTYTCEAVNCMGKTYSSSKLHISGRASREGSLQPTNKPHGPPPIFTSELKNVSSKIGDVLTLACQVMVPPWPKSVAWYNKEGKIESSEKYKFIEDGLGSYILEIKPAEYGDEGEWKFVVTSNEGTVSISTCSVLMDIPKNYRKPRFMENLKAILTDEGLVSFECKVVGFPTPLLRWFKDGHELKPGDVYQLTGTNSLGSYSCIARNCMGEACSAAVLTLEDIQNQLNENERIELQQKNQPPKFTKGLMSCETKINEEFKFTVQIKATTEPVFSWYRDDLPIDKTNERYEISTEKVGLCHLTIKCVEFVDQAEWKCVATNEFGHSTSTCFLKLQIPRHYKKPRFLECLRAVLTEEGAVNLECKVIGVPQPQLKWFKDGVELKPGDIHRIISGKDGECSLGTYTCEARNCMGVVTSSATLLGYEENYKSLPKPEPANILQRHLSLSTIHEERTSQLYDTPMGGDITVDDKGDVSFSFDGKEVSVSLYETPDLTEEEALQIVEMYADQISEHVTEQNIVELPPLRFVKETTQSGNLLMEAVVIDVSPDYFPPEEDMRTEADMEDISVVDAMSQAFEDPLSEQSLSKRRRKEESMKSGEVEEFFSLSQSKQTKPLSVVENYVVEEAHSDEEITETDLQTFESAKSSNKSKSDRQKKAIKSDDSLQEQPPKLPPRKRPATDSKDEESIYLQDISGEQGDGLKTQTKKRIDYKTITINKSIIEKVIKTVIIVKQHLIAVENEVVAQSTLMMSPTSGDSSIGIVKSVLEPINSIECKVNDYNGECSIENLVENLMSDLKNLNHGLSIIEKCVEMDSEGKTLVQRTSVCVIESVGVQMLSFLESLKQVCLNNVQGSLQNESLLIINDMQTGIHITEDTIKSQTLLLEATALEASQRVSETVAQMQQTVPEIVPLEIVTTTELPKEANSFKLLCRYILKFQEVLESSQRDDVKKETLTEIQKPIIAIQNEIHSIEEKISKNSLKDTIEEKISFKILDTVSPPLYELNKCFEVIARNVESGNKNPKILDPFILPLQEIQTGLALIGHEIDSGFIKKESPIDTEDNQKLIKNVSQNVIYFDSNIENIRDSTSMTVYDSLIQLKITISTMIEKIMREPLTKGNLQIIWALKIPLEELNYCFRHIEERSTSGSLRDLLDPLNSLKENVEVVEEKLRQMRISSNLEELKKIKNFIDQCDAEIQLFDIIQLDHQERANQQKMFEQQISENSQHLSELQQRSIWMQEKCDVLTNVQQNIVNIQEIIGFEKDESISEHFSTLKTLAYPLRELSRQIANIREEILLENVNDISINDYKAILKLANPIREICQQLAVITKANTLESAQFFSSRSDQEVLKSLAAPLTELRNCIGAIQHECMVLHEIQSEISHAQISLKTARPLEELRLRVEEIMHNIVEPDEISTTLDDISVMKTMSEMSEDVKAKSSKHEDATEVKVEDMNLAAQTKEAESLQHKVTEVTEKKSEDVKMTIVKEEKIVEIKQTDVAAEEIIQEEVKEKLSVPQEQEKSITPQFENFSTEIHNCLCKIKEEVETSMIAVQNMCQQTTEIESMEKELRKMNDNIETLPNNIREIVSIIESIQNAEKSIKSKNTSDLILVKYNLESLKKTLTILVKLIDSNYVIKCDEPIVDATEITQHEEISKVETIEQHVSTRTSEITSSVQEILKESNEEQKLAEIQALSTGESVNQKLEESKVHEEIIIENKEELKIIETQEISQHVDDLIKTEVESPLLKTKKEIENVKESIEKARRPTDELKAVQNELITVVGQLEEFSTNQQQLENVIEKIEKAELSLAARKTSDIVEVKQNLDHLKQSLAIFTTSSNKQISEQKETTSVPLVGELATIETHEELKIMESNEMIAEPEMSTLQVTNDSSLKTDQISVEKEVKSISQESVLKIVETSEELKILESNENIAEPEISAAKVESEKPLEMPEVKQEVSDVEQCIKVSKVEVDKTIESIKNVRRITPELQAIERQLSTTFENVQEVSQNEDVINEILKAIENAETSIAIRRTSDVSKIKQNFETLKQSLVILKSVIVQQTVKIEDISPAPQKASMTVVENKEELKIVENEKDDMDSLKKSEVESPLLKTKKEIENVKESIEKARRPTDELKAVQNELITVVGQLEEFSTNQQQLENVIEKIEKAELSLAARKTSDIVEVKQNLDHLRQSLVILTASSNKQIPEQKEGASMPLVGDLAIIETNDELKIMESNEMIAEPEMSTSLKTDQISEEKEVKSIPQASELTIVETSEELKILESNENIAEPEITAAKVESEKPLEMPKVKQEISDVEQCIKVSKVEVDKTIESIKNVRRITPELQAIERQLSCTFENVKDINDTAVINEILKSIETAEKSIEIRKTSDAVAVKENFGHLKQSLVHLQTIIIQQSGQTSAINVHPQKAEIDVIEEKELLKITETLESNDDKNLQVEEKPSVDETKAEIKQNQLSSQPADIHTCVLKARQEIENVSESIKKAKRPTSELQAAQDELSVLLEQLNELPENENKLDKAVETIEKAQTSLMARRTSDIVLVKDNLEKLKESLVVLKENVKIHKSEIKCEATSLQGALHIEEVQESLKIVESVENLSTTTTSSPEETTKMTEAVKKETLLQEDTMKPKDIEELLEESTKISRVENKSSETMSQQFTVKDCLEKSKAELENVVASIKSARRPTTELQAAENVFTMTIENISELPTHQHQIEKIIESIETAENSLVAKKTTDIVLVKQNLESLKKSLVTLKVSLEIQQPQISAALKSIPADVGFIETATDLKIVESNENITEAVKNEESLMKKDDFNELKIIESNEDLTITNETPKVEEIESIEISEISHLDNITLCLAKSRDEIENVMFSIKKARHPPTEVNAVEKMLTTTYEQLFELPKDEKLIEKAIESIELAEISLVTRGAEDLLVIKSSLGTLKESLITLIGFNNPQKAEQLLNELKTPEVAEIKTICEESTIKEEMAQESTNIQKLETQIKNTIDSIRKSRRPTPEVYAIEKELVQTIEKVSTLENNRHEIEKVLELIETTEQSLSEKRTSDIMSIKENLAIVKETLNVIKSIAKSEPIEIIELQQQKPSQAITKNDELNKDIVNEKSIEMPQASIELKEIETKISSQIENQTTQPESENIDKLKSDIENPIESAKNTTSELQVIENELNTVIEPVSDLQKDEKKIQKVDVEDTTVALSENASKLKKAMENVTSAILKVRRPTPELKSTESALKIYISKLSNFENDSSEIQQLLNQLLKAKDSIITKKTSDVDELRHNLLKLEVLLTELYETKKSKMEEVSNKTETVDDQNLKLVKKSEVRNEESKIIETKEEQQKAVEAEALNKTQAKESQPISTCPKTDAKQSESGENEQTKVVAGNVSKDKSDRDLDQKPKPVETTIKQEQLPEPEKESKAEKEENAKIEESKEEEKKVAEVKTPTKTESSELEKKPEEPEITIKLDDATLKIKNEIENVIQSIKKSRRPTSEIQSLEKSLSDILNVKILIEVPKSLEMIDKILKPLEQCESSLATKKTSDMVQIKNNVTILKNALVECRNKLQPQVEGTKSIDSQEKNKTELQKEDKPTAAVADEASKDQSGTELDQKSKADSTPVEATLKQEQISDTAKESNTEKEEKAKTVESKEEEKKVVEVKPPTKAEGSEKKTEEPEIIVKLDDVTLKLKNEIENVVQSIKKSRRPTSEIQSLEKSLNDTLNVKILIELPKSLENLDKILKSIEQCESALATKKTSDMVQIKNDITTLKNVLIECRNKLQPQVEDTKPADSQEKKQSELKKEEKPTAAVADEVSKDQSAPVEATLKQEQISDTAKESNTENEEKAKLMESKEEEKKVAEVKTPTKTESSENKTEEPEIIVKLDDVTLKIKNEIENVIQSIKKSRRPTSEIQSLEKSLNDTLNVKILIEVPKSLEMIDKILKPLEQCESSLATKKTSDMVQIKNDITTLKNVLIECRNKLQPQVEDTKPADSQEKKPSELKKEEKPTAVVADEVSKDQSAPVEATLKQEQILDAAKESNAEKEDKEKTVELKEEEKKVAEVKTPTKTESSEKKTEEPEITIKLDDVTLKIKNEIENVIQSIKKSRRPTSEIQSLEKSLNDTLNVKILIEVPKSLENLDKIFKSIEQCESALATKKTSDMVQIKNNLTTLKSVLVECRNKLQPQVEEAKPIDIQEEKKAEEKPIESNEHKQVESSAEKTTDEESVLDQPSNILLNLHEKDLLFQYIIAIKQDVDEVMVTIKKARRPSQELQTLHETLIDLKPKVDTLVKDSSLLESTIHIVGKAKNTLLTKRTMDMILLREKVTSLESSLTLLKMAIATEVNVKIISSEGVEKKADKKCEEESVNEKVLTTVCSEVTNDVSVERKVDAQNDIKITTELKEDAAQDLQRIIEDSRKESEDEPQRPTRRRKIEEPMDDVKSNANVEPEVPPIPTERRRQRQQDTSDVSDAESKIEPVKPSRRRRADELKEEEKSLPRTPESRRKRMPTFIARLKNRSASENSILKLTCAVSEPEVTAKWTKHGMVLKDSEKYYIENSNGVLSLEIKNVSAQDAGEYCCFVSNSLGEIETSAFVTIFGEDVQPSHTTFTKNLKGESNIFQFIWFYVLRTCSQ